jgi:hypothetical protein
LEAIKRLTNKDATELSSIQKEDLLKIFYLKKGMKEMDEKLQ